MALPLQAAAIEGHSEAVKFLSKGSPVDERSDVHNTALIAVVSRGRYDVLRIQILVEAFIAMLYKL